MCVCVCVCVSVCVIVYMSKHFIIKLNQKTAILWFQQYSVYLRLIHFGEADPPETHSVFPSSS